jgi:hypothetical protein
MMPAIYIELQLLASTVRTALFGLMLALFRKCRTPTLQPQLRNVQYMQELRAKTIRGRNTPNIDIELFPELRELRGKVSHFALREIRQQITPAKKEEENGNVRNPWNYGERCYFYSFRRFGLPFGIWYLQIGLPSRWTRLPLFGG